MEVQIKKAVKAGNSSAVILPRAWLNKKVRVELIEKSLETILFDVLEIIKKYMNLEKVIGIYLVGSCAREEAGEESDIDVLVISDGIDKELISEGVYNVLIVSEELAKWKLKNDLFPIGSMIKEAVPLLNSDYLKSLKVSVTRKNVNWYIKTTEEKLRLIKEILEKCKEKIDDRVIYTLVLRIRTLYIIQKLIKKRVYSTKEFKNLITKISGSKNVYNSYLSVKNNSKEANLTRKEEAEKLYRYLKKQLDDVKKKLRY